MDQGILYCFIKFETGLLRGLFFEKGGFKLFIDIADVKGLGIDLRMG